MDCEVAREALSARLDGEREPVPSVRVDQHLDECAACREWFDQVGLQARQLRRLVESRPVIAPVGPIGVQRATRRRRFALSWQRWALLGVGAAQIVLAVVQGTGLDVGLHHGMDGTNHLLHESTAWSVALGVAMVVAALWPAAAAGLAGVLTAFVAVLAVYVAVDAASGAVTLGRILTHLPVVLGAVLAAIVWRITPAPGPTPQAAEPDIVLPDNASRGRRRGHLWPTDGSAA
ncbi:zf-HC2 domain-containing protein [Mycobacterium camsae]|uniref:zf-HC2 domain-containing protein n=1 Tax=Mycobacterium gordonae TaxID=1778 RepID=UPI00197D2C81|nr:zf-HC2 domain-containing protein [Mycobacterium gordonae]